MLFLFVCVCVCIFVLGLRMFYTTTECSMINETKGRYAAEQFVINECKNRRVINFRGPC